MAIAVKKYEDATLFPTDKHAEDEVERRQEAGIDGDSSDEFDFVILPHDRKPGCVIQVTKHTTGVVAGYL